MTPETILQCIGHIIGAMDSLAIVGSLDADENLQPELEIAVFALQDVLTVLNEEAW